MSGEIPQDRSLGMTVSSLISHVEDQLRKLHEHVVAWKLDDKVEKQLRKNLLAELKFYRNVPPDMTLDQLGEYYSQNSKTFGDIIDINTSRKD